MIVYNSRIDGILYHNEKPLPSDREYIIKCIEDGLSPNCIGELINIPDEDVVKMGLYILSELNPNRFPVINEICMFFQNKNIFIFDYYILRNIHSFQNYSPKNYYFILKMLLDKNELLHSMALACLLDFSQYDFEILRNTDFEVSIYNALRSRLCASAGTDDLINIIFEPRVLESIDIINMSKSQWKKFITKTKIKRSKFSGIRKVLESI